MKRRKESLRQFRKRIKKQVEAEGIDTSFARSTAYRSKLRKRAEKEKRRKKRIEKIKGLFKVIRN